MKNCFGKGKKDGLATAAKFPRDFRNVVTNEKLPSHEIYKRCNSIVKAYNSWLQDGNSLNHTTADNEYYVEYTDDEGVPPRKKIFTRHRSKRPSPLGKEIDDEFEKFIRHFAASDHRKITYKGLETVLKVLAHIHGKVSVFEERSYSHKYIYDFIKRMEDVGDGFLSQLSSNRKSEQNDVPWYDEEKLRRKYPIEGDINYCKTQNATLWEAIDHMIDLEEVCLLVSSSDHYEN